MNFWNIEKCSFTCYVFNGRWFLQRVNRDFSHEVKWKVVSPDSREGQWESLSTISTVTLFLFLIPRVGAWCVRSKQIPFHVFFMFYAIYSIFRKNNSFSFRVFHPPFIEIISFRVFFAYYAICQNLYYYGGCFLTKYLISCFLTFYAV